MPIGVRRAFEALVRSGGADLEAFLLRNHERLAKELQLAAGRDGLGSARRLDRRLAEVARSEPSDQMRRAAIARLALGLAKRLPTLPWPTSVKSLYPKAFETLSGALLDGSAYDPDFYAKDARFVAGATVPAGGQILDVVFPRGLAASGHRLLRLAANVGRLALTGDIDAAIELARSRGWKPWLEVHTEQRSLANFNEPGWDAVYKRAADILADRPDLAGLWGASWFYDPQLEAVSPHLTYLRRRPIERGAILVRLGRDPYQTRLAMQASSTRRAQIESGRYRPACFAIFWPRKSLLAWASDVAPV